MSNTAVVKRSEINENTTSELSATAEMAVNRQTQEVQGAMVIAKKFPRDVNKSFTRIIEACKRKTLAEVACYEYPRGDKKITGASIRLAETMAQNWGNLDFGVIELDQRHRESTVMAYCWDLETNTRQTKIFQVPHIRYSKEKGNTILTDPRDIYEMIANQGARRVRACILGIIPGDIQDAAIEQCDTTMKTDSEPLADRIRKMILAFKEIGVSQDDIEVLLRCKSEACTERDMLRLRKIWASINDGMAKKEDYFTPAEAVQQEPVTGTKTEQLAKKLSEDKKSFAALNDKLSDKKEPPKEQGAEGNVPPIAAKNDPANSDGAPTTRTPEPPASSSKEGDEIKHNLVVAIRARKKGNTIKFNQSLNECAFALTTKGWEGLDVDSLTMLNEKLMERKG